MAEENVSQDMAGGDDVAELKTQLEQVSKARDDFKGDMFKFKEQNKELAEKLEALQEQVISDEDRKFLEEQKAKIKEQQELEARKDVDSLDKLRKAEIAEVAKQSEQEKKELKKQLEANQQLIRDLTINSEITKVASELGAVKPEQIVALLSSQFEVVSDNGTTKIFAPDENGDPRKSENGVLGVADVVKDFLNSNQHFLRASDLAGGTGTKGSTNQTAQPNASFDTVMSEVAKRNLDPLQAAAQVSEVIKG